MSVDLHGLLQRATHTNKNYTHYGPHLVAPLMSASTLRLKGPYLVPNPLTGPHMCKKRGHTQKITCPKYQPDTFRPFIKIPFLPNTLIGTLCELKANNFNLVTQLKHTPIHEWCVTRCGIMNENCKKHMFQSDWTTC